MTDTGIYTTAGDRFHKRPDGAAEACIIRALDEGKISARDAELIRGLIDEKRGLRRISNNRALKIAVTLINWRGYITEFQGITYENIVSGLPKLYGHRTQRGHAITQNSIHDHIVILKMLIRYLADRGLTDIDERHLARITAPKPAPVSHSDDVLTESQIAALFARCKTAKMRAMLALLYEGALRIGELGTLCWSQVEILPTHINLRINFKTGIPRQIPIVVYQDAVKSWATLTDRRGEYVFTNNRGQPYNYQALAKLFRGLQGSGSDMIPFHPHLIRHSRITHMILSGMSRETVSLVAWGTLRGNEIDRYAHLYGAVDDLVLQHYGVKKPAAATASGATTAPTICASCGYLNPPDHKFCVACHRPLTSSAASEFAAFTADLTPEKLQRVIAMLLDSTNSTNNIL